MNKRQLIILTSCYPYRKGAESFLEDELKIAKELFGKIYILAIRECLGTINSYLPENAIAYPCKKKHFELYLCIKAIFLCLHWSSIKEIFFAYNKLNYKNIFKVFIQIFLSRYSSLTVARTVKNNFEISSNDIIYSYWGSYSYSLLKKQFPKNKFISRTHGSDCFIENYYTPFKRESLTDCSAIYPISEAGRQSILKYFSEYVPLLREKIIVSRLGVLMPETKPQILPKITKHPFRIVSCSHVIKLKRLDIIINALSEINDIDIEWIHFGDGKMFEEIKILAQKLLKNLNVKYDLKGYIKKEKILEFYKNTAIDIFINCSDTEGIPVSIMEAMSYGIPTIARNIGGNAELVNNLNGCLLKKESDYKEFIVAIKKVYNFSNEEKIKMRMEAYKTVEHYYNAIVNFQNFYKNILDM